MPARASGDVEFGSNRTVAVLVRKFTLAVETPSAFESAFSIVLAHEAHVMPLRGKSTRSSTAPREWSLAGVDESWLCSVFTVYLAILDITSISSLHIASASAWLALSAARAQCFR